MRMRLPMRRPRAYAYQFYAFPLMVCEQVPASDDWVFSNYIQLALDPDPGSPVPFCFYFDDHTRSPWWDTQRLTRQWLARRGDDIVSVARDALADGWYVYLTVNERYVPHRLAHLDDTDYPHDLLIFGCDDSAGDFDLLGYDERQQFAATTIPQDLLRDAYEYLGDQPFYDTGIVLYRPRPSGHYRLDHGFIADSLEEYLTGADTSARFQATAEPMDRIWGAQAYPYLIERLRGSAQGTTMSVIDAQVLWEHKHVMLERADHCLRAGVDVADLMPGLRRIERLAWTLRTVLMTGDRAQIDDAPVLIEQIAADERDLVGAFVGALRGAAA
ncbi:hypothetical protein [Cellulomonas taurus]|uniref:hypothetical protein n=1 Tax=Cellulomonas taurus TaxID=2729175 RepID=UPI00145F3C21|nr:hypothetical protein [Cellulomonas taurus]